MKILVIDAEKRMTDGLKLMIQSLSDSYEVYCCNSSKQALELFATLEPEILMTAIRLPEMDGLRLIEQLQERYHFKSIIVSSCSDFDNAKKAFNLQCSDYLLKPVNKKELAQSLKKVELECTKDQFLPLLYSFQSKHILLNNSLNLFIQGELQRKEIYELIQPHPFFSQTTDYQFCLVSPSWNNQVIFEELTAIVNLLSVENHLVITPKNELLIFFRTSITQAFVDRMNALQRQQAMTLVYSPKVSLEIVPVIYRCLLDIIASYDRLQLDWQLLDFSQSSVTSTEKQWFNYSSEQLTQAVTQHQIKNLFLLAWVMCAHLFPKWPLYQLQTYLSAYESEQLIRSVDVMYHLLDTFMLEKTETVFSPIIAKVLELSQTHLDTRFTLKELGVQLNINAAYLGQLFYREVGISYHQYMQKYRMASAERLIKRRELTIGEIATQLGFADITLFYRHYKKVHGVPPNQARMLNNKESSSNHEETGARSRGH